MEAQARRFNVANCGRRFGKNVLGHDISVKKILEHGRSVGWGSPTYKNLADDWRTLTGLLQPIERHKSEQDHRIELVTDSVLEMWSLDNPDAIRGRAYDLFVVNEAASVAGLMDIWNMILLPTLIDTHGEAWFKSTPRGQNAFYQLHLLGRDQAANPDWASWTYTSYANPHLDPAELDAMRKTMPEREYRQEILAEFLSGEGVVFRNIEASCHAPLTGPEDHKGHTIVGGIDWGKQDDFTAISLGCSDCRQEVYIDRFNQIDYAFQRQRIQAALSKWNAKTAKAELNAMGDPIVEQLQRDGVKVQGFKTTQASKAAIIESLSLAIEQSTIQLQPNQVAQGELEAYERTVTQTGMSKYSAPPGLHDDTVIARALMYSAMLDNPPRRAGTSSVVTQVQLQYEPLEAIL